MKTQGVQKEPPQQPAGAGSAAAGSTGAATAGGGSGVTKAGGGAGGVWRSLLLGVGFTGVVVLLLLWLAGFFEVKIGPGHAEAAAAERPVGAARLVEARLVKMPAIETAVGTVRAVHETALAAKILAKVETVNVQAGQRVARGDVLLQLDDEDLEARARQAAAAVEAAEARLEQARFEHERVKALFERGNETRLELDRRETALRAAQAELEQARQALRETETNVAYAVIRSPIDGVVIDKQVEAGDTATPGQVLLTLYDPDRMQLVASVRESLTQRLEVGQQIAVRIDALHRTCDGTISEIVPEAESASRTFQVKVTGPCPPGVYSGMFGRLLIPLDAEDVLLIPRAAVRKVGQLDVVEVAAGEQGGALTLRRRSVQLGRSFDDDVEVLAGLRPGERVAVPGET